jgi:LmbE family N-acetylglucosaminyl deacetylase
MKICNLPGLLALVLFLTLSAGCNSDNAPPAPLQVLLITAHPDDETLFNLGRFRERGWRVSIALVTNGEHGGVVQGIKSDYNPKSDDDILIEKDPAAGVWLTLPPDGPRLKEIVTPIDLARQRRAEFLGSMAEHRVATVLFLSDPVRSDFEDSWDHGVSHWDQETLAAHIKSAAQRTQPDLIITLNPDEVWAHRQHSGLGHIVKTLHAAGDFDRPGAPRPALYGLREHGWYPESQVPQIGDLRFDRAATSSILGQTYEDYWRVATGFYLSQSSHPTWFAARVGVGLLPGYGRDDLIRRLDDGREWENLDGLFMRYPPDPTRQDQLPKAIEIIDLSN